MLTKTCLAIIATLTRKRRDTLSAVSGLVLLAPTAASNVAAHNKGKQILAGLRSLRLRPEFSPKYAR